MVDKGGLTGRDLLRNIFPNRVLRDFVNEATDRLMACCKSGVIDDVLPKSEEAVAIALLDP
jgi:hypothetical protein